MPKRSLDLGPIDLAMVITEKTQRKTERSHEENQERAYIAASRRADRSIEARVQSARMASEIHKKRTGKGFRISEEIVIKEEMHEEEEDEFPRSYRLLGPHMQTSSSEMNSRVEAYLTNKVAMSALVARTNEDWARENEINRLFAQSFPNAGKQAAQLSHRLSTPSYPSRATAQPKAVTQNPTSPTFQPVSYGAPQHERKRSRSGLSPTETLMAEAQSPPPALTPGSNPETPQTHHTPNFNSEPTASSSTRFGSDSSIFTSELPAEAKMFMAGFDMNDTFSGLYDHDWLNSAAYCTSIYPSAAKLEDHEQEFPNDFYSNSMASMTSNIEEPWDTFIHDSAWATE